MKKGVWYFILCVLISSCSDSTEIPVLSIGAMSFTEGDQNTIANVVLELSNTYSQDVSFELSTETGTASFDDFRLVDTILFIRADQRSIILPITIIGDDEVEKDEVFYINIEDPFNASILEKRVPITILNDDDQTFIVPSSGYVSADSYAGMTMVWEEDFKGSSLNLDDWTYEIGDGCAKSLCGWGNNELQSYTQNNTTLKDGYLVIEAREETVGNNNYTSSRIISQGKQAFQYGRIDIRAALPFGKGIWPAVWMLGGNFDQVGWPACGEIDIMEMVGGGAQDAEVHGTVHWSDSNGSRAQFGGSRKLSSGKLNDEFHVYSIEWTDTSIAWFIDDTQYHIIDITPEPLSEFHQPHFFIMNLAVGGNWPGEPDATTVFPQWLIVDYIRVFQ